VAARLSLSFPGLISAVPLFCVDWSRAPGKRTLIEAWFSDGGISSNFPMHLFDAFWPCRPTFGINLQPPHPDSAELVWRPEAGRSGIVPRSHPISSMLGFLQAILDTMQNWVDSTQITVPGYRDRVVEVRHLDDEGGINLKMPRETIQRLADRGAAAAAQFDTFDFDLHRWIRYRVSMSELDELLEALSANYGRSAGYEEFLAAYGPTAPNYGLGGKGAAAADQQATRQLMELATTWADAGYPSSAGTVPRPKPLLRIVPRQ
jgi:predicted acylesterase/phospholipase RssA